jgi:hypothetical protein
MHKDKFNMFYCTFVEGGSAKIMPVGFTSSVCLSACNIEDGEDALKFVDTIQF